VRWCDDDEQRSKAVCVARTGGGLGEEKKERFGEIMKFGRCKRCAKAGWLKRSKKLRREVCASCIIQSIHPTIEKVVCAPCGMEVRYLLAHLKLNPRCPAAVLPVKMGNGAGRGAGQGLSYRNSRQVPWDAAWDNDDHVIEEVRL
jgi:hypothetical protein